MATRLFMRATSTAGTGSLAPLHTKKPTAGDKSTALPVGTDGGDFNDGFELTIQNSTAGSQTLSYSSLAQTAQQSAMIIRFSSAQMAAQTINANTWTIAFSANEGNAAANAFLAVSVYVYRPSTNTVVGFIRDSATTLGVEFAGTIQTVTFSGSAVTASAGDFLVLEMWNVATQGMATSYTISVTTSSTANQTYIETPQDLKFLDGEQFYIID